MYDGLRTVSHAFGLVARNALITSLERRAGKSSFGGSVFLKEKLKNLFRIFHLYMKRGKIPLLTFVVFADKLLKINILSNFNKKRILPRSEYK